MSAGLFALRLKSRKEYPESSIAPDWGEES